MQSTCILMSLLSFIPGPWPVVSCPRDYEFLPGACKLMIVKGCRHHIASLKCCLPEESLCSLPTHSSLSFPGQFVLSQIVVALGSDKQELFECYMEASRNGIFQIVSNASVVLVGKVYHALYIQEIAGARGILPEKLGGVCSPLSKTPTLFVAKICDFCYLIYNLAKI